MRDNISTHTVVHLGALTLSGTTTLKSDFVDTRGYDSCTIVLLTNDVTNAGTAAGFTATLQESADTTDAAATAVAAASVIGTATTIAVTEDTDDDVNAGGIGYVGVNRYVGLNITGTTGTDAEVSVVALLGHAHVEATTFVGTSVPRT